ncbi:Dyp-type peroxidase [Jatrophihabitans telluris]|uniref:Dyp-type peroxidase n=1 Tax=Jatrophihabitans telluris TaxID=2038343 RepID=A0ABY4QVA1_9ACTN|nr:Dyp-type peroxidase [Jatrophihabitans telluris]UQX87588.1 Dyp-type peroxidase [Jatrophihabitans telluris]
MSEPIPPANGPGRRTFLRTSGLVAAAMTGGAVAGTAGVSLHRNGSGSAPSAAAAGYRGSVGFFGPHQAGIIDQAPAHLRFIAFDLGESTLAEGRTALATLMRRLSQAAAQMTAGRWIPEQGSVASGLLPAGLSVTFGFGPRLVRAAGVAVPPALAPLPSFPTDELVPSRSGGDLAVQVCAEDELLAVSVARALGRIVGPAGRARWTQNGFLPGAAAPPASPPAASPATGTGTGAGTGTATATPRNLMGQLDGTDNPNGARRDLAVWVGADTGPDWMVGGSYLVCRRIRMLLDVWDRTSVPTKEAVIGRRLDSGAPLTGGSEHSTPSFSASGADGRPVIAADAHLRLTHPANNGGATMLRRGYSYDDGLRGDGAPDAGLFFQAFQTDPREVFVPIQRKLAARDALERFIRHESSALFAVPPGAEEGGWVGQRLLG